MKIKASTFIVIGNSVGIILQFLAIIFGYFRKELFGIEPGYAPHNFSFNIGLILPLTFLSLFITFIIAIITFVRWKKLPTIHFIYGTFPFIIFMFYFLLQSWWIAYNH